MDAVLLPNATRLFARGDRSLQFVSEVMRGDIRKDGNAYVLDIITALTAYAVSNPVIPIGSTGSLDFSTGILMLPDHADYEIYQHEISAKWVQEKMNEGFLRALIADPEECNECAMNGTELPHGKIAEGLTRGDTADGWTVWWLGDTPETAESDDQTLIFLRIKEDEDLLTAWRTSRSMIAAGESPVDVSLFLYRDSSSDRMGIEKYNVLFFDTPAGEKGLVKIVTGVLGRTLEMPKPINVQLRATGWKARTGRSTA